MGMPIVVDVRDPGVDDDVFDAVFDWFRVVDETFSTYKDDSEISRINRRELAAVDAADLAVVVVRAEGLVDEPEPVEHAVEHLVVDDRVADVDDDRHSHHVLDPVHPYFQAFSIRIADCSD